MEPRQIVPQPCVFSFYSGHVGAAATCELEVTSNSIGGFTHNLSTIWNKARIDAPPVCNVEVTLPGFNHCPQRLKGFGTTKAQHPS